MPLLEPKRVSRLLGVEVETLGVWRRRGYGPRWYRIGKKVRYAETDLLAWMSAQAGRALSGCCGEAEHPEILPEQPYRLIRHAEGGRER